MLFFFFVFFFVVVVVVVFFLFVFFVFFVVFFFCFFFSFHICIVTDCDPVLHQQKTIKLALYEFLYTFMPAAISYKCRG